MARSEWIGLAAFLCVVGAFFLARSRGRASYASAMAAARAEGHAEAMASVQVAQAVHVDARTSLGGTHLSVPDPVVLGHINELRHALGMGALDGAAAFDPSRGLPAYDNGREYHDDGTGPGLFPSRLRDGSSVHAARVCDGVERVQIAPRGQRAADFLHVGVVAAGDADVSDPVHASAPDVIEVSTPVDAGARGL